MDRATWKQLDELAEKIGKALGLKAEIDRGGTGVKTRLRINGYPVLSGTKNECYHRCSDYYSGIRAHLDAIEAGKAECVTTTKS